jgi:hypothetical protein
MSLLSRDSMFEDPIEPLEPGDEQAIEAVFLAHAVSMQSIPLPTSLRDRLVREGHAAMAEKSGAVAVKVQPAAPQVDLADLRLPSAAARPIEQTVASSRNAGSSMKLFGYLGWAAAAALAIVTIPGLLNRGGSTGPGAAGTGTTVVVKAPTVAELAAFGDSVRATFKPDPSLTDLAGATGEVIWNDRLQTGYMRLSNLPTNDPKQMQYQLWIVDPDVDKNPVDGGVFDVASASGEVIVPIDAKLAVNDPKVFAITRERPGGVVVSGGPLALVASR